MSLRPNELGPLAAELTRELAEAAVQKVSAPAASRVYLELRVPGRTVTLLCCAEPKVARLSAVASRPPSPPTPPGWQSVLRRELTGARLRDVEALAARRTVLLHFTREGRHLTLVLELGPTPTLALCSAEARVLALSTPAREGLRVGQPWAPLPESAGEAGAPSRLAGEHALLRLAHAAEALFGAVEQRTWTDARKAPLLAKRKRLLRTMDKVRAEAGWGELAARYRREGELLRHQLHLVRRGEQAVRLTEYLEDGTQREVEVPLDPKRTPQQEVEWRFHQYRRLSRGAELARARLEVLARELEAVDGELRALDEVPVPPPATSSVARPRAQPEALPYREYRGHGGQRLWVGRGAAHNDRLTFHVARPFHVWLHARGVPGAHVVVPLDKGAQLSAEVLIDAAHLAVHHSDVKGEPRAEVSYTPVKFVHKPKGAGPGAVSYTREKTLVVRLEPERLARLLSTLEG